MVQDFRYGMRMLAKTPGILLIAVLTMSIGIGANVTIFSFVDEIWLRPLLAREPNRVVCLFTKNQTAGSATDDGTNSYLDFQDLRAQAKSFSGVALLDRRGAILYDRAETKTITAAVVSDNFFDVLQVTPALGRTFTESEAAAPGTREVVLSYPFWRRQFNADRSLIGRTIVLNSQEVAVTGILPRGFRGSLPLVQDVWMPVSTRQQITGEVYAQHGRETRDYDLYARLKDGVTLAHANAELASISANLAQEHPRSNRGRSITAVPESQTRGVGTAAISLILLTVTGLVLLIACANVATLLIARAEYRRHEIATRVALGASRWRIVRQLIAESVVIAVLSTAVALLFAHAIDGFLPVLLPQSLDTSAVDAHLSLRALGFALFVALGSVFLFGLLPSLQASHFSPIQILKQRSGSGQSRATSRSVLVVLQIALSLMMVVGTGLLARSLQKLAATNPGFDAHQDMLVADVIPGVARGGEKAWQDFVQEGRRRIEALPGVTGTAVAMRIPFGTSGSGATRKVFLPNMAGAGPENEGERVYYDPISDSFFEVLGTRLIRGRTISKHEVETGVRVMVVNQLTANRFWPNVNPVGQRVRLGKANGDEYEVVGVVENGIYAEFGEAPKPYLFTPMMAGDYSELELVVKTSIAPEAVAASVQKTLRDLNPDVPAVRMVSLRDHVREAMYAPRIMSSLVGTLGGLGLLLSAVGLYGLMSFLVGKRTHEIGIRLALGARRSNIFNLIMKRVLVLTGLGVALGIAGAAMTTQALRSLLFGVRPNDLVSFAAAVLILAAVACCAALVPALRATKIDPMKALRCQ